MDAKNNFKRENQKKSEKIKKIKGKPFHFVGKTTILDIIYGESSCQLNFWPIFNNKPILEF